MLSRRSVLVAICSVTIVAGSAQADEARSFHVTPSSASVIVPKKDHISIRLVSGWTSAEDTFFQSLLNKNDKLAISVASDVTNFDGTSVNSLALLLENSDIARKVNKPWGADKILVDRVPADSAKITMTLRAAIDKSSRLGGVLNAFSRSAPATLELGSAQWFGYSKALVAVLDEVFGTDKTKNPFIWTGDLREADLRTEHYIVLLAKNSVSDKVFDGVTDSDVSFDGTSVKIKDQPIANHSFAVLKVMKTDGYDIALLSFESKAPWASFAQASFLGAGTFQASSAEQLQGLAATRLSDLDNELVLLKEEPRFSAYDRALALQTFAAAVRKRIVASCARLEILTAQCPTGNLDLYIESIASRFGLPPELKRTLPTDTERLFVRFAVGGFIR